MSSGRAPSAQGWSRAAIEASRPAPGGRCVTSTSRVNMGEVCKTPRDIFLAALATAQPGELVYGREVLIAGAIGAFDLRGSIDFVVLLWDGPRPLLRLVESKAARRERTYQRIQVAVYGLLMRAALAALPLVVAGVRFDLAAVHCVVACVEAATNKLGDLLTLPPLDLTVVEDEIERLLAPDGRLFRIYASDEDVLEYQLDPKCDTCTRNSACLAEAAR